MNYHPDSLGPNSQAIALYEAQVGEPADTTPHGHAVAGLVAAKKNDTLVHGIAFDAQVLAVDFFSNVNETQISQGGVLYHVSDPWSYITSHGSKILSVSFGYDTGDIIPNPPQVSEAYVIASPSPAVANGALLVASAGNSGGANPSLSNQDLIDELSAMNKLTSGPGAFVIAGSVDTNNQISSFSNRAGNARDHYMVAPGEDITVLWMGGLGVGQGTSFSAPLISGAAALILDRWPNLTGREIADILFQSATDLGAAGVDVDLRPRPAQCRKWPFSRWARAALWSRTARRPRSTRPASCFRPRSVTRPEFRAALAQVTILDGFGRDFTTDASRAVYSRPNMPDLFGVMEQRFRWRSASYDVGQDAQFSYTVREDRTDAINAFRSLNGAEDIQSHETVFQFSGTTRRNELERGHAACRCARRMSPRAGGRSVRRPMSLTNAFFPAIGSAAASSRQRALRSATTPASRSASPRISCATTYAGAGFAPDSWTSFGGDASRPPLWALAVRLRAGRPGRGRRRVSARLPAGGLKLSEQAATVWSSATSEDRVEPALVAEDVADRCGGRGAAPGLQPHRVARPGLCDERLVRHRRQGSARARRCAGVRHRAAAESGTGAGDAHDRRRASTRHGAVIMTPIAILAAPSGREFDLETAYRFALADWDLTTSVAYSLDANHVRGQNAVTGVVWLSRRF